MALKLHGKVTFASHVGSSGLTPSLFKKYLQEQFSFSFEFWRLKWNTDISDELFFMGVQVTALPLR